MNLTSPIIGIHLWFMVFKQNKTKQKTTSLSKSCHHISSHRMHRSQIPLEENWVAGLDLCYTMSGFPLFPWAPPVLLISNTVDLEVVSKQATTTIEASYPRRKMKGAGKMKNVG